MGKVYLQVEYKLNIFLLINRLSCNIKAIQLWLKTCTINLMRVLLATYLWKDLQLPKKILL